MLYIIGLGLRSGSEQGSVVMIVIKRRYTSKVFGLKRQETAKKKIEL